MLATKTADLPPCTACTTMTTDCACTYVESSPSHTHLHYSCTVLQLVIMVIADIGMLDRPHIALLSPGSTNLPDFVTLSRLNRGIYVVCRVPVEERS